MNKQSLPTVRANRSRPSGAGLLLLALLTASALSAQQPTPDPKPADPKAADPKSTTTAAEEPVTLSAFTVSTEKDVGYRASNSLSGTRTDTPIKEVPLNIQVFTKEFYEDLLITNQVDLERYNAAMINGGADAHSDNPIQQTFNAFLFRGFTQNWSLRDGIREYDPIDTQGLSRVEVIKGPAAPLYGLAYPGGIMNNISKEVEFARNFTALRFTVQSEGELRGSIDANYAGKVGGGKFGVRYNGAQVRSKDERAHSEGAIRYSQINLGWEPFPTTQLKFIAETGYREKPNGVVSSYFQRGETNAAGVGLNNGASIPLQAVHPEIPWTWNWSTGTNFRSLDTKLYRGTIDQSVGDNFQVTGYIQFSDRTQVDGNGWDANGSGGGDSWEAGGGWVVDPVTKKETIQNGYSYRDWSNSMHAYGATGVYKVDFGPLKNKFYFGANVWAEKFLSRSSTQAGSPSQQLLIFDVKANIDTTSNVPPPPIDFHPVTTGNGYQHQDNSNDYYFAGWQMSAMENRLRANIAVNHTNLKLVTWVSGTDTAPTTVEQSENSPLIGVMFDVTKEITLWANHAESLFPNSLRNSFGVLLPAIVGSSYEGGVKLELMQGKISGTVSYYQITQTGGGQFDPLAENLNTSRWDAMTPAQRAVAFPGQTRNDIRGDQVNGAESESKGFEADLIFSPNRNWQAMLSFATNKNEITSAIDKTTIGQSNPGSIKNQFSILTRYSFTDGQLKNAFVGVGAQFADKSLQSYFNSTVARYYPSTTYAEVFAGYRMKVHGYNTLIQFNAKNLTKQDEFVGWKATGSSSVIATEPYKAPTVIRYSMTFGIDF